MAGTSRLIALRLARTLSSSLTISRLHRVLPFQSRPLLGFQFRPKNLVHTQSEPDLCYSSLNSPSVSSRGTNPWPEWVKFVDFVVSNGYSARFGPGVGADDDDSYVGGKELGEEFVRAVEACVGFARDRPELLRWLSKEDIRVVMENCTPSLFKNGGNSTRRLKAFLNGNEANQHQAIGYETAETIDIMRYLLSYVWHSWSTQEQSYSQSREIIERASRKLFSELMNASSPSELWSSSLSSRQNTLKHESFSRPSGQNIEMKKGDWICPKCSFMNFARNIRCLECNDARPKRVLAGGEWECPQCDFFNYSRNMSCIRCDCRRPVQSGEGVNALNGSSSFSKNSSAEQILSRNSISNSEIDRKLAANDEKAERWFSKISQLGDTADLSSAAADEDFPEIMPMRKGVNRFVVSTRKTSLERRLSNNQNNINQSPSSASSLSSESISKSLDRIFGRTTVSGSNSPAASGDRDSEAGSSVGTSEYMQRMPNKSRELDSEPSALRSDAFSKSQNGKNEQYRKDDNNYGDPGLDKFGSSTQSKIEDVSFDTSERGSNKVAECDNIALLPNAKSDNDYPDIIPMRKGENRFIISKKKDRSFTAPQYKRRIAMEQVNNSNFAPFVPLPSDYFAKKDEEHAAVPAPEGGPEKFEELKNVINSNLSVADSSTQFDVQTTNKLNFKTSDTNKIQAQDSKPSVLADSSTQFDVQTANKSGFETSESYKSGFETSDAYKSGFVASNTSFQRKEFNEPTRNVSLSRTSGNHSGMSYGPWNSQNRTWNSVQSQYTSTDLETSNTNSPRIGTNEPKSHVFQEGASGNYSGLPHGPWNNQKQSWNNSAHPQNSSYNSPSAARPESADDSAASSGSWKSNFPMKSLEGSAVSKEPDPLDMSQEAKAQRWFRRVAQIKDISELANIPDEDFPDIMPMRKGVNRFVVSKRKTPLERRLTSPQYRKNLPIISSEPDKDSS